MHYSMNDGKENLTFRVKYTDHDELGVPHWITVQEDLWEVPGSQPSRHAWKITRLEQGNHLATLTPADLLGIVPGDRVTDFRFDVPVPYDAEHGQLKSPQETLALAGGIKRSLEAGRRVQQLSSQGQLVIPSSSSPGSTQPQGSGPGSPENQRAFLEWVRTHGMIVAGGVFAFGCLVLVMVRRRRAL